MAGKSTRSNAQLHLFPFDGSGESGINVINEDLGREALADVRAHAAQALHGFIATILCSKDSITRLAACGGGAAHDERHMSAFNQRFV